jgi:hypothetical protein
LLSLFSLDDETDTHKNKRADSVVSGSRHS